VDHAEELAQWCQNHQTILIFCLENIFSWKICDLVSTEDIKNKYSEL